MRSESTFESRTELVVGTRMPAPFSKMCIGELLRRTESGGWLYLLEIDDADAAATATDAATHDTEVKPDDD